MAIRVLHTSDWHFGAALEGLSREEDQECFSEWLLTTLAEQHVDVLVVSGDVFDQAHPSAEAQHLYFRLLSRVRHTGVRHVIIVAGNHDSASRIEAPRELLRALDIDVVGGISADRNTWERCICPLRDRRGAVCGAVLAVPFVHEYRLGVRTCLVEETEINKALRTQFRAFYAALAERARALTDGPIMATGHLACVDGERDDAPVEVHLAATLGGLPPEIFDERLCYVALGHYHRMYRVRDTAAWYSGSPVPLCAKESRAPRRVLLVDLPETSGAPPIVTPIAVPVLRQVLEVSGSCEGVLAELREMGWSTPRPPLVQVTLLVERFTPGCEEELRQTLARERRELPQLIRVVQRCTAAPRVAPRPALLRELSCEEVFRQLCLARGEPLDADLLAAFRSLAGEEPLS